MLYADYDVADGSNVSSVDIVVAVDVGLLSRKAGVCAVDDVGNIQL